MSGAAHFVAHGHHFVGASWGLRGLNFRARNPYNGMWFSGMRAVLCGHNKSDRPGREA